MLKLRDYQVECCDSIMAKLATHRSTMAVIFTAGGKTACFTNIIQRFLPGRTLVLAGADSLIWQAKRTIERWTKIKCGVEMAGYKSDPKQDQVILATWQTMISGGKAPKEGALFDTVSKRRMHKFKPDDFDLVVLDECFPAGTLVDGKPIETYSVGDSVTCFDGAEIVTSRVSHVFKSKPATLVRISAGGKSITCTAGHPIFTQRGYVAAAFLTPCDMVLQSGHDCLLQTLHSTHYTPAPNEVPEGPNQIGKRTILRPSLHQRFLPQRIFKSHGKHESEICLGSNEVEQSNEARSGSGKGFSDSPHLRMETANSRRQRETADNSAASYVGGVGLGYGSGDNNEDAEKFRLSQLLQSGRWKQGVKNRSGSRWKFSSVAFETRTGCEKGSVLSFVRVDSVTVLKQEGDRGFERLCPGGFVYNLEVERHSNYFANGILVHNCHHSAAESYRLILNHFKQNPKLKILGVTATPRRGDGLALGEIFETVAFEMGILQGALNGWLVDIVQHEYKLGGLDYSHLKVTKGDFDAPELKSLLEKQENVAGMCHPILEVMFGLEKHTLSKIEVAKWRDYLAGLNRKPRKTLLFTVSVMQAEMACDIMNRVVPDIAGWVCGKHSKDDRKKIFDSFEAGKTSLLANVGITVEGYDHEAIEVIAMGRPTLSISTYIQMIGRGTRVLPGIVDTLTNKEDRLKAIANSAKGLVRIIDFKGNSGRHNLITTFDVLGGKASEKAERAKKRAAKSDAPKSVLKTLSIAEAEIEKEKRAEEERRKEVSRKRVNELVPKAHYQVNEVSPFKNHGNNRPMPTESRNEKPFSPGQRKMLLQWGFPIEKISYRQGQGVIGRTKANGWKLLSGDKAWAASLTKSNPHNYKPKTDHEHAKHDYQLYLEKITA